MGERGESDDIVAGCEPGSHVADQFDVDAGVDFGMEFGTLRHAVERVDFGQHGMQRAAVAPHAVLPEVDALYGVPQRAEYHPEVDTGIHIELVCDMAARLAPGDDVVGFAALTHDLGKALTPVEELPKHILHEKRGEAPLRALCERLRVPAEHRDLALLACREHLNVHRLLELRNDTVHDLLARCDAFRKPERIPRLALVCEADKRGRAGLADRDYPQGPELLRLHAAAASVRGADLINISHASTGLSGPELGEALRKARIAAIAAARR